VAVEGMSGEVFPHYRVERAGRWVHYVTLVTPFKVPDELAGKDGGWFAMESTPPWLAFGRRHAERLGIRKLRAYLRREAWKAQG
jgi:hypothetical protein